MKKKISTVLAVIMLVSLCACGRVPNAGRSSFHKAPFSQSDWTLTYDDMVSSEGEPEEEYASIYGGQCYTYTRDYLGRTGTLKYMFADDGKLASVAWAYVDDNADEINGLYSEISEYEKSNNGGSSIESEENAVTSGVWYLDDCDILVYTIFTNGSGGLQYSYVNRDYSKRDIKNSAE